MKLPWQRTRDANNMTDFLANCIDAWHKSHPDLMVSEILKAIEEIRSKLTDALIKHADT